MRNYKIAILMATYNGEKYLKEQIESILNQTYTNWVLFVNDDQSTDSTYDILTHYSNKYPNKIIIKKNDVNSKSPKVNFMNMVKNCPETFDFYMFSDQDDVWLENKIQVNINEIKNKKINFNVPFLLYSDLLVVNQNLDVISNSFYNYTNIFNKLDFSENLLQNNIVGCTTFFNLEMLKCLKKIDNYDKIYMHDWIMSLIAQTFGTMKYIDSKQILYRQHENNALGANKSKIPLIFQLKEMNIDYKKTNLILIEQATLFYNTFYERLNSQQRKVLEAFASTKNANKIKRMYIYQKYGLLKKGTMRRLKQIIFG